MGNFIRIERNAANRGVNVAKFINFKVNFTSFHFLHGLAYFQRYCSRFWIGHQAAWSQNLTQTTNFGHYGWHGDDYIYVRPAFLNFLNIFVQTHVVGPSFFGFGFTVGAAQHQYAHFTTCAVWKSHHAANHLVGFAGINSQTNININRSVEFSVGDFFQNFGGFLERIRLLSVIFGHCLFSLFCQFCHCSKCLCTLFLLRN